MSGLVPRLFGPPQIERDGTLVHIGRRKAVALLAYLAITRRAHGRDELAALLWPEMSQRQARSMVRSALVMLNTAIGRQWLTLFDDQVALADQPGLLVDVTRFEQLLTGVAAHGHATLAECNACVLALRDAVDTAQAPLLAGFSLADAPEFDLWQSLQRDRLQREVAAVFERLALAYAGRKEYQAAIDCARCWLALDSLHEPAHCLLMQLFAEAGDRHAALRQFEECGRILAEELDAEPSPETVALRDRILAGRVAPMVDRANGQPATPPRHVATPAIFRAFPDAPTGFVGRTAELEYVTARLVDPSCRLLTIVGPGGMGKTRLAIEAARSLAPRFADGAWFVDLAPVTAVDAVPAALLRALDVPGTGSTAADERLLAFLADKQMLLVLDNFEHLLGAADFVSQLLAAAPAVRVLVTTRAHLQLQHEWLLPLEGLNAPPRHSSQPLMDGRHDGGDAAAAATDLLAYDATRLFVQCVQRQRPDFRPDGAGSNRIAHICRLLEGMPLAIELTASWARRLSLDLLAREVEDGLRRLASTARDVLPRHRNMVAVFDHSWHLLDAREQAILRTLSLFRGGFTLEAAEAVARADVTDLAGLLDASWIRLRPSGRYDMHELVRQYCETHLAEDPTADEARSRYCTYFGDFISRLTKGMNYNNAVMDELMADFGNLELAWYWGVEHGRMVMVLEFAISIYFIADMLGHYRFALESNTPIKAALERTIAASDTNAEVRHSARFVIAWMNNFEAHLHNHLGQTVQARQAVDLSCSLAAALDASRERDEMVLLAGWPGVWVTFSTGDIQTARRMFCDYLSRFRGATDDFTLCAPGTGGKFWAAHALGAIGTCDTTIGNYAAAVTCWREVIVLREELGEQRFLAANLSDYAETAVLMGDLDLALDLAQRGLTYSNSFGDQLGVADCRIRLGVIAVEQGQWAIADGYLWQSLALGRQSGNRWLMVGSLITLAKSAMGAGDIARALEHCNEALSAASISLPYVNLAPVLLRFGECALAENDYAAARRYFVQALGQAPNCPAWSTLDALWGMAQVLAAGDDVAVAGQIARQIAQDPATAASTRAAIGRWYPALFGNDAAGAPAANHEEAEQGRLLLISAVVGA